MCLNKLNHDNLFNRLSKLFLLCLSEIFLNRTLTVKPVLKAKKAIINIVIENSDDSPAILVPKLCIFVITAEFWTKYPFRKVNDGRHPPG